MFDVVDFRNHRQLNLNEMSFEVFRKYVSVMIASDFT